MTDVWIRANGQPIPQGSKGAGKTASGRLFVRDANPGLKAWRENVAQAVWRTMNERDFIIESFNVGKAKAKAAALKAKRGGGRRR